MTSAAITAARRATKQTEDRLAGRSVKSSAPS